MVNQQHDARALIAEATASRLPLRRAGFTESIKRFFRHYMVSAGRASRSEFWWPAGLMFALTAALVVIVNVVSAMSDDTTGGVVAAVGAILILALSAVFGLGSICLTIRRLHDANVSGWWYFLTFIPLLGWLVLLVFGLLPPKPEGARFDA